MDMLYAAPHRSQQEPLPPPDSGNGLAIFGLACGLTATACLGYMLFILTVTGGIPSASILSLLLPSLLLGVASSGLPDFVHRAQ